MAKSIKIQSCKRVKEFKHNAVGKIAKKNSLKECVFVTGFSVIFPTGNAKRAGVARAN